MIKQKLHLEKQIVFQFFFIFIIFTFVPKLPIIIMTTPHGIELDQAFKKNIQVLYWLEEFETS